VKSNTVPKHERVLRWDGTDWAVAGLVSDSATIMKQGLQVCDFNEALAFAHGHTSGSTANLSIPTMNRLGGVRSRAPGSGSD
jgi:hypothetical protein